MTITLAENLRALRRGAELSQEEVAERVGVAFQTVSKWERGETLPDVTMLPVLASLFAVSVDELLGVGREKERREVQAILDQCAVLETHYQFSDEIPLLEEGLKKYPNNYELMAEYANVLQNPDPARSLELCERILARCLDSSVRNRIQATRCYAYYKSGQTDKAIAAARELPHYYSTSNDALRMFLRGKELLTHVQDEIVNPIAYEFWFSVRKIGDQYAPNERIELYKKSNAVYDALYETDDVPFKLSRKMRNYEGMAEVCLEEKRVGEALAYLRQAAECAAVHDALPEVVESKALLFSCHPYDRKWESCLKLREELLHDVETEDEYALLRERGGETYAAFVDDLRG